MWLRLAACAVVLLAPCLQGRAQSVPDPTTTLPLTLPAAFARVADVHPELRLFGARQDVLSAELAQAQLRPALQLEAELENALTPAAEFSLSLASVLERGGKLDARRTLANQRIDALAVEREKVRLDVLAETARRFQAVLVARAQITIAELDIDQRQRATNAAGKRFAAGASPRSTLLSAQAAQAQAELQLAQAQQQQELTRRRLAALWGERVPQFQLPAVDLLVLPQIAPLHALAALLAASPELRAFVDARRLGEARLQLARSDATPDLGWSLGLRRSQAGGDLGLIAGLSLPLGTSARAQPAIRAAQGELAVLAIEREAQDVALYATLVEAHGRYFGARQEVATLGAQVLPKLADAEAEAQRAYRAGAISYLEWAQVQSERVDARRQQLAAAQAAQSALIELQRLTGQPLLATQAHDKDFSR